MRQHSMYYAIMNLTSIYLPKIIGNAISAPIPSKNLRDRARRYIRFILDEQLQPLCKTEKLVANHLQTNYIKHKISQYQPKKNQPRRVRKLYGNIGLRESNIVQK